MCALRRRSRAIAGGTSGRSPRSGAGAASAAATRRSHAGCAADALRTASGLSYKVLARGDGGAKPSPRSEIEIHYSAWTTHGRLFDSSVARDQRALFRLDQLIQGWQEGVFRSGFGANGRIVTPPQTP